MVHVRSQCRQRQHVVTVMTLASVSTALPLQNGHMVGLATNASENRDADIVVFLPQDSPLRTYRNRESDEMRGRVSVSVQSDG